jgi:aminoglycoside phosphotransferase (APT) family kinase protein
MNEPWAPEYRLQPLEVERILSDNTELEVKDVVVLDEGWDFFCYLINETFVFRFPKRRAEAERLIEEKALLAKLNLTTKTPHFDFWVDRPVGFHLPFAGYPLLSGTPLFEISKVDVDPNVIGSQLGQALRELHAQMLTPSRLPHDPVTEWLPGAQNELENIANVIDCSLFEACGRLLTSYQPRNPSERQVTTHGDLHAGHVLVDEQGQLAGIIDWTDAHTSNRYTDFAGLWAWGGDGPVIAAFNRYRRVPTSADWAQLRTQAIIDVVQLIDFGIRSEDAMLVATGQGWLRDRQNEGVLDDLYAEPD